MLQIIKKLFLLSFFLVFVFFAKNTFAGINDCRANETQSQCELRLRNEIAKKEAEIKRLEKNISQEKGNQQNLSSEIAKLRREISSTEKAILEKSHNISQLRKEIQRKEFTIQNLNEKLKREKESLAKILRKRYELGEFSLFELLMSGESISQFFENLPLYSSLEKSLIRSFQHIKDLKSEIYEEKVSLEEKKQEEANTRYALALEKGKIEVQKKDRDLALRVSKSREATLAALKKKRQEEIRKIRATLIKFQGSGIQSKSISFGEAYDYAKLASQKTGVRTAFIMAIMQQETGFGRNVGGCYLRDDKTGDGIYIRSGKKAKRTMIVSNIPNFKKITSALGRDWKKTPVSCAIYQNGKYYGYGGAMGYTQFIPNSWMSVARRVESYLNTPVANPWNPRDAVMATGIFLRDKGAAKQSYQAEYQAACRYYGNCGSYAPSVMKKAIKIQTMIDTLERDAS